MAKSTNQGTPEALMPKGVVVKVETQMQKNQAAKAAAAKQKLALEATGVPTKQIDPLVAGQKAGKVSDEEFQQFKSTGQIPESTIKSGVVPSLEEATKPSEFVQEQKPDLIELGLTAAQKKAEDAKWTALDDKMMELDKQLTKAGEVFKQQALQNAQAQQEKSKPSALEIARDEFLGRLDGVAKAVIPNKVADFEKTTGKLVDWTNPMFQEAAYSAISGSGELTQSLSDVMEQFSMSQADAMAKGLIAAPLNPTQQVAANIPVTTENVVAQNSTQGQGVVPEYVYAPTQEEQLASYWNDTQTTSVESGLNDFLDYDSSSISAATILKNQLQNALGVINDPSINQFFDKWEYNNQKSYEQGLALSQKGIAEIDLAAKGKLKGATTYEGLSAKIAYDVEQSQLKNISLEKDYQSKQYDLWKQQQNEYMANLEGYMKAKLYAMGAQDSSAGLMLLSKTYQEAQFQITAKENEYLYGMEKLTLAASQVMTDYTNNIQAVILDAQAKESTLQSQYQEKQLEIDKARFDSDQDKKLKTLSAINSFYDGIQKIKADADKQKMEELKFQFDIFKNAQDQAYKTSGLTGTVWVTDEDGNLIDTEVPTFDASKWKDTYALDYAQYQRALDNDSWTKAGVLLEAGKYAEAAQIIGAGPDFFTGSKQQMLDKLDVAKKEMELYGLTYEDIIGKNGLIASMYPEKSQGGQCGAFVRKFFTDLPTGIDTLKGKMATINSQVPKVGSAVITSESYPGTNTGHIAIINKIEDGYLYLTESNYIGYEQVSNTRKIAINDPKVMGYFEGTLKPELQQMQDKSYNTNTSKYFQLSKQLGLPEAMKVAKTQLSDGAYKVVEKEVNALAIKPTTKEIMIKSTEKDSDGRFKIEKVTVPPILQKDEIIASANQALKDEGFLELTLENLQKLAGRWKQGESKEDIADDIDLNKDLIDVVFKAVSYYL